MSLGQKRNNLAREWDCFLADQMVDDVPLAVKMRKMLMQDDHAGRWMDVLCSTFMLIVFDTFGASSVTSVLRLSCLISSLSLPHS
jgi:hypothetical protein